LLNSRIKKVKEIHCLYGKELEGIEQLKLIPVNVESGEIPVYVEVFCREREELILFLVEKGIQCRPFYPNLNCADYFKNSGYFPNSERFEKEGVYLPCGPEQPIENVYKVVEAIREFY